MYGLAGRELRFALVISSAHFAQHAFYRVLPPLIPVLAVALEYPLWQLGLLISLYSIGMGLAQAPLGVLSDRIDRVYLLPTGIALTGAAYVLFALAPILGGPLPELTVVGHAFEGGFLVMTIAMLFVGVGLAVVHPAGYPMITDNVAPDNKGKVLGLFGASSKLGDAAAPAVIAGLIIVLGWEQIILAFGLAGVVFGVLLYVILYGDTYETVPSAERDEKGDGAVDRREYLYPMIAVYGFFITSMMAATALTSFLPTYLVAVYGFTVELGGLAIQPESVANLYFAVLLTAGAVTQLFLGGLADVYDARTLLIACMGAATVGMVALAVLSVHPLVLVLVVVVLGAGLFGVNPARDTLISDLSPPEREGRTFGYVFTAVTLTGAPLPTVVGYLLEVLGMRPGYLLLAIGPVLAIGCVALLYSDRIYRVAPAPEADVSPGD